MVSINSGAHTGKEEAKPGGGVGTGGGAGGGGSPGGFIYGPYTYPGRVIGPIIALGKRSLVLISWGVV